MDSSQEISVENKEALAAGGNAQAQERLIKNSNDEVVGYFDEKTGGVVFVEKALLDENFGKEAEKVASAYVDNLNLKIEEKNLKAAAEFQNTEDYKKLSEEDKILATYQFRKEHDAPRYLGSKEAEDQHLTAGQMAMEAFKQTEKYKQLNSAEKIIAYGEFRKKIDPGLSDAIDKQVFITLKNGMGKEIFNAKETQIAANYMRDHYIDGYEEQALRKGVETSLAIRGKKVTSEEFEQLVGQEWSIRRGSVDADVTRECLSAIDRDKSLSSNQKKELKISEISNYCSRVDNGNAIDKERMKNNMMSNYPEVAREIAAQQKSKSSINPAMAVYMAARGGR